MRTIRATALDTGLLPYAVLKVSLDIRKEDEREIRILHRGETISQSLSAAATRTWSSGGQVYGLSTGRRETVALLGIRPDRRCPLPHGRPWLICTNKAKWYAKALTDLVRDYTDAWASQYGVLANACLASNTSTLRWLTSIGFVPDYADPIEQAGHTWVRFTKEPT